MRQSVRQARICVINKLIREAKRLRTNSNEKQLEKNKNKAEKLLKEVFALKHIKEDEISKFGIVKFEYLQDILQNSQTDDATRAMVKVVRHKSLSLRIIEFQKKFPDYNKHISWRKKKSSVKGKKGNCYTDVEKNSKRLKNDANNILKKEKKQNCFTDFPEKNLKQLKSDSNDIVEKINKEKDTDNINCIAYIPCQQTTNVKENDNDDNDNLMKISKIQDMEIQSTNNDQSFKITTKIISNEATVKRFTEILQETKEQNYICRDTENQQSFNESMEFMESSNKIDDFFLPANEITSCSNETLFSKEKSMCNEQDVNHVFKSRKNLQIENKNKLYNKKINKERNRKQFMNNADFHNQNDMIEKNNTYRKQNEKNIQVEKKRKVNKESTCIAEHDNLHPSWAAKKKQQNIMKQEFQGKKIKFDED